MSAIATDATNRNRQFLPALPDRSGPAGPGRGNDFSGVLDEQRNAARAGNTEDGTGVETIRIDSKPADSKSADTDAADTEPEIEIEVDEDVLEDADVPEAVAVDGEEDDEGIDDFEDDDIAFDDEEEFEGDVVEGDEADDALIDTRPQSPVFSEESIEDTDADLPPEVVEGEEAPEYEAPGKSASESSGFDFPPDNTFIDDDVAGEFDDEPTAIGPTDADAGDADVLTGVAAAADAESLSQTPAQQSAAARVVSAADPQQQQTAAQRAQGAVAETDAQNATSKVVAVDSDAASQSRADARQQSNTQAGPSGPFAKSVEAKPSGESTASSAAASDSDAGEANVQRPTARPEALQTAVRPAAVSATATSPAPAAQADTSGALPKLEPASSVPLPSREETFAARNQASIVTAVRGQANATGGTMTLRLDPPELGALNVSVRMVKGVMTAQFTTSNPDAAQLLSHSLGKLKVGLEQQGIGVERLQVQQVKEPGSSSSSNQSQGDSSRDSQHNRGQHDQPNARNEQQRRELMDRLWKKMTGSDEKLDVAA